MLIGTMGHRSRRRAAASAVCRAPVLLPCVVLLVGVQSACKRSEPQPDSVAAAQSSATLPVAQSASLVGDVDKMTVTAPGKPSITLERRSDGWTATSPSRSGRAKQANVESLLKNMSELRDAEVIAREPSPDIVASHELDATHAVEVSAWRGGQPVYTARFGKNGGRGQTAMFGASKDIHAIKGYSSFLYVRDEAGWIEGAPDTASTAVARTTQPAAYFSKEPELLRVGVREWLARIADYAEGEKKAACPDLEKVTGDEFQRHEQEVKILAKCESDVRTAREHLKQCPAVLSQDAALGKYDFDRHRYPIAFKKTPPLASPRGRVDFDRRVLLSWPGAKPSPDFGNESLCVGGMNDTVPALAGLVLALDVAEGDAKALSERAQSAGAAYKYGATSFEVAFILDGGSESESMPCGMKTPAHPTGRALAWRLVHTREADPIVDWQHISDFSSAPAPGACAQAAAFLSPKSNVQSDGGGEKPAADPTCVCRTLNDWDRDYWFPSHISSDPSDADRRSVALYARLDRAVFKTVEERPGCPGDGKAKSLMAATATAIEKHLGDLEKATSQPKIDETTLERLRLRSEQITKDVTNLMAYDCKGPKCRFGCRPLGG